MKNLIYQFWTSRNNKKMQGVKASRKSIKKYADRIGAEHLFEDNPKPLSTADIGLWFGSLNPVFREEFHQYDNVLFLDADVHAVDDLEENIFEGFDADVGFVPAAFQSIIRTHTKVGLINKYHEELWAKNVGEKWNITIPRTDSGLLQVCNSGVVLYSNKGMKAAKKKFISIDEYIQYTRSIRGLLPFYQADENYLFVALLESKLNYVELDPGWNTFVTYHEKNDKEIIYDRNENTKLVHIQFAGSHGWSEESLWKVTNLPVEEWELDKKNVTYKVKEWK